MAELPIACSLTPAQLGQRKEGLLAQLVQGAAERSFLEEGARFRFASSPELVALLARVIAAERECCRFLRFDLTFEPDLGPVRLEITGPAGTREFLQTTLDL